MSVPETFGRRGVDGAGRGPSHRFEHHARVGELFPIVVVNTLLGLITLTVYRFWGKTRVRRYLWSRTTLRGDPLEYTGTGGELFKGFLVVFFLVLVPLGILNAVVEIGFGRESGASGAFGLTLFVLIFFLVGVALYRARRYRLSRTLWRGVRAGQTGSATSYGLKYLAFILLLPVTLGWSYPWQRLTLMRQMMQNTWFGDRPFAFEGGPKPLYKGFAVAWFAAIVIVVAVSGLLGVVSSLGAPQGAAGNQADGAGLGMGTFSIWHWSIGLGIVVSPIALIWYSARELRYFAECTRFEGLSFRLDATWGSLLWLVLGNLLLNLVTLGFGLAVTQMRTFRYLCDRLEATGRVDFDAIIQNADRGPRVGEGLAEVFDVGAV